MAPPSAQRFDARAWLLFAAMAVLWGMPYLFIKQAVETFSPASVVVGRTLIGALILLPFALRTGALRLAWKKIGWVLAFAAIEMAGPFVLLGHAEQTLPSGLTGLLVATVPLFAALISLGGADRSALSIGRTSGLVLGFIGVAVVVAGPGLGIPEGGFLAIGEVLLVALLYAVAPFIVSRRLNGIPTLGTATLALSAVGLFYLPIALLTPQKAPTFTSTASLVVLGVFCTAVAFVVFFALIGRVGPLRAPLFTYVNPVVAVVLGTIVLGESVGPGLLVGFPIVVLGCWLAATGGTLRARPGTAPPPG